MAHHLKVETAPAKNKDGSPSKTKKIYTLIDRTRGQRVIVASVDSKKTLAEAKAVYREWLVTLHTEQHPRDLAFKKKHGLV